MTTSDLKCPKCKGAMEEGFIADMTQQARVKPSKWVEGQPVKSFWEGTKISDKEKVEIATYRCTGCGYLESYAK